MQIFLRVQYLLATVSVNLHAIHQLGAGWCRPGRLGDCLCGQFLTECIGYMIGYGSCTSTYTTRGGVGGGVVETGYWPLTR